MTIKLLNDDDGYNDDVVKIEIDEEYARRFEHNKKREDLHRYEELKKKGLVEEFDESEESESEEDDEDIMNFKKKDLEFFNALIKVRNQDPSLKEKDVKLFDSDESDSERTQENKEEREGKNPMYLKDVVAKHLIEEGPEFKDEEEDSDGMENNSNKRNDKTYGEEQEELRKEFLDAVEEAEDDDNGGFLRVKENNQEDFDDGDNKEFVKKLDEYFGRDGELDEKKMFLKDFFMNKMWMDKENKGKKAVVGDDELDDLVRDEEQIERQEEYETNYRYEENAGDRVMGHSRKVDGSVRKKENARKEQRKSKEERMKIAEIERQEELKHLKNLKKKEIKERMKKVFSTAGFQEGHECPFSAKALEDEFDPEEYDRMMKAVFDEKYYDAEDADSEFGSDREDEKPDFEKEDELLGLPKGEDVLESGDGFLAARERSLKHKLDNGVDHENDEEEEGGEEETEESKRKRKRKISLVKRAKEEMMEEYYKLDYEDTIGDLKTRFKYAKIPPNRYGLSTPEILMMDDQELNQYVSLKKITPYRQEEWKIPDSKRYQQKMKNKELLRGGKMDDQKTGKKKRLRNDDKKWTSALEKLDDRKTGMKKRSRFEFDKSNLATRDKGDEKTQLEKSNGDMINLSRRAKRRQRQAELKLSHSRLMAYGKISSQSKVK